MSCKNIPPVLSSSAPRRVTEKQKAGKVEGLSKLDVMQVPTQIERAQMDIPGLALAAGWIGLLLTSQHLSCSLPSGLSGSKLDPQLKKQERRYNIFSDEERLYKRVFQFFRRGDVLRVLFEL
ncbi:UNVERIFIED_CONTAM: hypothetical protein HHA_263135 [Hammondia hammondi]|eukprot:XP_008887378.1 hypothetical protein HHA_263135 [Hammondia hammondi]